MRSASFRLKKYWDNNKKNQFKFNNNRKNASFHVIPTLLGRIKKKMTHPFTVKMYCS